MMPADCHDLRWFLSRNQPVAVSDLAEARGLTHRTAFRRIKTWREADLAKPGGFRSQKRGPDVFLWAPAFRLVER